MPVIEIAKIQVRRGQENQTGMPQLDSGEFGWAEDTENLYIGKRIVDGAVDDANTRILTENDLNNIFGLIYGGGAVATTSTYKYRDTVPYINSSLSTMGKKLDNTVSLTDYGLLVPTATNIVTDITTIIKNAVADIFNNQGSENWADPRTANARRRLLIPAGNYSISDAIHLPPYASLEGEGPDLTCITLTTVTDRPMFKTVDAEDNDFESANMQSSVKRSRDIRIADMTLQYLEILGSDFPLISLDNTLDAEIRNVHFQTKFDSTSTTTYGLVDHGVGIQLRGTGGGIGTDNLCENILIADCKFDGLYTGVQGTGTVIRPVIQNSIFSNLNQGIVYYTTDTLPGPTNGVITQSRFEKIVAEAIYVGENDSSVPSNVLSNENFFIQVGNGVAFDDFTTSNLGTTPVINFLSQGNKSVNDYFHRSQVANSTNDVSFYYNPFIGGRAAINDDTVFTATVVATANQAVIRVPVTGHSQMVTLRYQLSNDALSRAGNVLLNISPDGYPSLTDTYNYSEGMYPIVSGVTTATIGGLTTSTQFAVDTLVYPDFADPTLADGTWFLTGSDVYAGYAAAITGITVVGDIRVLATDSAGPQFDFTTVAETWTLLKSDSPDIQFQTNNNDYISQNYIQVVCTNPSERFDVNLEFQTNLMV